MPCRGAWPHLIELDRAHRSEGLVVLALSDEIPEVVERYLEKTKLPFPVAAGSSGRQRYGIRGIPHSILIDAAGRVIWRGHPTQLGEAEIRRALEGVDPLLRERAIDVQGELAGRAAEIGALAREGELEAALAAAAALSDDATASEAEHEGAERVRAAIRARIAAWVERARTRAEKGERLEAARQLVDLLDLVGDGAEAEPANALLRELRRDPTVARELDAEAALAEALELAARRGPDRARGKLEAIVRDFPGTRAADRARILLQAR